MDANLLAALQGLDDTPVVRDREIARAPFPYPGSKYRSLKQLTPLIPYRSGYCEPFGGSGNVLIARKPSKLEVFNDRYSGITCFYRCIRDRKKMMAVHDRLEMCLHGREEFIWCRDTWKNCEDEIERAARWYYMILMSFSSKGKAFGRSTSGRSQMGSKLVGNLKLFGPVHNRFKDVQIENLDWRVCLRDYDQEDMVWYLDPTYYPGTCSSGVYDEELTKVEHKEMCDRIFMLKGYVVLSGFDNELYNEYPWNEKHSWEVKSTMLAQAFSDSNNLESLENILRRGNMTECVWIKH